jgi:5'-3' exonuclease
MGAMTIPFKHMLIDGKNAIYRAIFAGYRDKKFRKKGHNYFVILIRFISSYVNLFKPDHVHIFWDAPRSKLWRCDEIEGYKQQRQNKYKDLEIDIRKELSKQVELSIKVFSWLNCRQYYRPTMEADDLIYAFCAINNDQIAIVSSDQDFRQITQKMDYVHLYNPLAKEQQVEPRPKDNIVVMKALMGDKSDNITGYYNVGPKRSAVLAKDHIARAKFFESDKAIALIHGNITPVNDTVFKLNRRIIDLSWCPFLADNCEYVEKKQISPVKFDLPKVEAIIRENKIRGLLTDLQRYSSPFKATLGL